MAQEAKLRQQVQQNTQYLLALNTKLDQLTARVAHIGETLAAVVGHLGEDVITAKMESMRAERKAKREAELEKSVEWMLNEGFGKLAPEGATINLDSFVVGEEHFQDGTVQRVQHEMKRLDAAGQKRWFGKKVGDEVTEPGFPSKCYVKVIYQLDMAKVQEYAARKKAEALAAQQAAANPAPAATPKE